MSEEEFKEVLNEVYNAGYEDGMAQGTMPMPMPQYPQSPYWDWTQKQPEITCDNTNDTNNK